MGQKIYQIDAFTDKVFSGNPAAVCPLVNWLSDDIMMKIAAENNLAETAFYVKNNNQYDIRWFTPTMEVDLCGHATLATAFVLFNHENYNENIINFYSHRSGFLTVSKDSDFLTLNFPTDHIDEIAISPELINCFDLQPISVFKGRTDFLFIYERENNIIEIKPDFNAVAKLDGRGVIITAKGDNVDFVSRFFAPQSGIMEDSVTGSAHTTLIPYWAKQLDKPQLRAIQLSERKGFLKCKYLDDRVEIGGQGKLYLIGEIQVE